MARPGNLQIERPTGPSGTVFFRDPVMFFLGGVLMLLVIAAFV